jgi:hypothetical protein
MSNSDVAVQRLCMKFIDEGLHELHKPGMTADTLYVAYTMSRADTFIALMESFNDVGVRNYARRRAMEICAAPQMRDS